jgi:hypothetical protein
MVVFPAPFGPTRPSISPGLTVKEIESTALIRPKYFVREETDNMIIDSPDRIGSWSPGECVHDFQNSLRMQLLFFTGSKKYCRTHSLFPIDRTVPQSPVSRQPSMLTGLPVVICILLSVFWDLLQVFYRAVRIPPNSTFLDFRSIFRYTFSRIQVRKAHLQRQSGTQRRLRRMALCAFKRAVFLDLRIQGRFAQEHKTVITSYLQALIPPALILLAAPPLTSRYFPFDAVRTLHSVEKIAGGEY